jgi:general stress protein YciG
MAIRPNSEERSFGADRERQREVSNESGRSARSSNADSGADDSSGNGAARTRSNRGFASMDRSKQREIASKGGRAAHEKGTAHEWTPDEARNAGRKGGQISRGGRGRLMSSPAGDVNTIVGTPASGAESRRAD